MTTISEQLSPGGNADAVNLASRIKSLTIGMRAWILITDDTRGRCICRKRGTCGISVGWPSKANPKQQRLSRRCWPPTRAMGQPTRFAVAIAPFYSLPRRAE